MAAGSDPSRTERTLRALAGLPQLAVAVGRPPDAPRLGIPDGLASVQVWDRAHSDPVRALELRDGDPLFLIEDGCEPPPRFTEGLRAHVGAGTVGGPPAWVAAGSADPPNGEHSDDTEAARRAAWFESRAVARRLVGVSEHAEEVTSPLLLVGDASAWVTELRTWWTGGPEARIELPPTARLLLARDVLADPAPDTDHRLRAAVHDPLAVDCEPATPDEARGLRVRLAGALASGPRPVAALRLAELCLRTGHHVQARSAARAGLELWPRSVDLALLLSEAETQGGAVMRARARLEDLLSRSVLNRERRARLLATLGETWRAQGDADQAEPCFAAALDPAAGSPAALVGRGRLRLEAGDFRAALADLRAAVQHDSLFTVAWYHLGRTLAVCGSIARSRDALGRALDIHPEHREARLLLERLATTPVLSNADGRGRVANVQAVPVRTFGA